ncbi:MAG: hypothetical protein IJB96_07785 [Lachnospira sp.]|nr:hypothetical protein [Lachnospira sp.]
MDYETFKECVKERIDKKVKKGGRVVINHILKNNGMELDGLVIMEKDSNVAPTIYINSYYEELKMGRSIDSIVDELFEIHKKNRLGFRFNPDLFNDYNNIKKSIVYKVINYEKNKKLLKTIPHKRMLDLAVVYYCLIERSNGGNATALIHNEHIKTWKVSEETLHKDAVENTPELLQSCIKPMSQILNKMAKEMELEGIQPLDMEDDMYVLTNIARINGAACMLYEKVLEEFADYVNSDLYILPSSIHEVIILPKLESYDKELLVSMVREVNSDGVCMDEILSDNVYEYNRKDKMITL